MTLSSYKNWLEREGYCASTAQESVRRLDKSALGGVPEQQRHMWPYLSRYLRFVAETKKEPLGAAFTRRLQQYGLQPARKRRLPGSRRRKSLSEEDFTRLRAHLRTQKDATSRLLLAYMFTDRRVGLFLCLTAIQIDEVKDKKSRDWLNTLDVFCMHEVLDDAGTRGAYVRMRNKLAQTAQVLGLTVDLNTLHRYAKERVSAS